MFEEFKEFVMRGNVAELAAGAPTLNYGAFLQAIVDFVIVAFAVLMLIKQVKLRIPFKATCCAHCTSEVKPA